MVRKHRTAPRFQVKADDDGLCGSSDFARRANLPRPSDVDLHPKISGFFPAIPSHKRGVGHRHERGVECGGRGSVLRATGLQGGLAKGL